LSQLPAHFVPYGIELSPELAAQAAQVTAGRGGRIVEADALSGLEQFPSGFFSGVIMRSYLEHELFPREVLTAARRVLGPGCKLIVKVPNYACFNRHTAGRHWPGYHWPDHVNYFTPATLRRMMTAAGYRIASFTWLDRFPFNDNMWLIAA
jgi:SAM-dependent methyltransferase